jgi:RNA polymerase sigma-70 factor (ECF subfamily)
MKRHAMDSPYPFPELSFQLQASGRSWLSGETQKGYNDRRMAVESGREPKIPPLRREAGTVLAEQPDDDLMQLAAGGVSAAFAELVRRYQERVRSYCTRWCGDSSIGDDLAQDVFGELWRARTRYRPSGRLMVYLFTIARNRCRNLRRDAKLTEPVGDETVTEAAGQLDGLLVAERRRRVEAGIHSLPPKLREAILLRFGQELDYAEVADILSCPQATVRSRVFLGLRELRRQLGQEAP